MNAGVLGLPGRAGQWQWGVDALLDLGTFLDEPLIAVLASLRADGSVLLSPIWHEWRDGGFNAKSRMQLRQRASGIDAVRVARTRPGGRGRRG